MAKMNRLLITSFLLVLFVSHQAYSRSIKEVLDQVSSSDVDNHPEGRPSLLEWGTTESCEATYGFLPCSTNIWGLLFLIIVYNILLSFGAKYVGVGSELFFKAIGPDHMFGASLFQFLGTAPEIALVLVSSLSGSVEDAQKRATMGMGIVAGTSALLLTLLWGVSVVVGCDNPEPAPPGIWKLVPTLKGDVETDVETKWTAQLIAATLIPFLILSLARIFNNTSGRSWIVFTGLIATATLLFGYVFYQTFQPWIRHRRFEHLMDTYAQDTIVNLFSTDGKPDQQKMTQQFKDIDQNNSGDVSLVELRVWLSSIGMKSDEEIESIFKDLDQDGDDSVNIKEFVKEITKFVSHRLNKHIPDQLKHTKNIKSQNNGELQQGLISSKTAGTTNRPMATKSWLDYAKAIFFITFGIGILCAMAEPLTKSVVGFSEAANLSSFWVSYLAIPIATHYLVVIDTIESAMHKSHLAISLTLSSLYSGVFMNNVIGLIVFLAPVFARNLTVDVFRDVAVVVTICIMMTLLTSFRTRFPRWMGYAVLLLYPFSLALVYLLNSLS